MLIAKILAVHLVLSVCFLYIGCRWVFRFHVIEWYGKEKPKITALIGILFTIIGLYLPWNILVDVTFKEESVVDVTVDDIDRVSSKHDLYRTVYFSTAQGELESLELWFHAFPLKQGNTYTIQYLTNSKIIVGADTTRTNP